MCRQIMSDSQEEVGPMQVLDGMILDGLWDPYSNIHMGTCAERCAREHSISRAEQDAHAIESHERARRAQEAGFSGRVGFTCLSRRHLLYRVGHIRVSIIACGCTCKKPSRDAMSCLLRRRDVCLSSLQTTFRPGELTLTLNLPQQWLMTLPCLCRRLCL